MENNSNTATATKREFRPIFTATITPKTIEALKTKTGGDYLKMTGATVEYKDKSQERTVMAFGKSIEAVGALLEVGKPVELAVQFDNGSVRIIGEVRAPAAAEG